jgi:tRNA A22 N-methylase
MRVQTLKTLSELTNKYNELVNNNENIFIVISEIFESPISFSFRVFENHNTKEFYQVFK